MNENDEVMGVDDYLLSNATLITVDEAPSLVEQFGGICYPAHIDREANGIIATLGTFPDIKGFKVFELNDGNKEVILTGKWDNGYFPPYIYTTTHIRGASNKQYTIKVEYEKIEATAITTIPSKPTVDSIKIIPTDVDSLCQIKLCITDNPNEKNFYKIFVKKRTNKYNKQWLSSYLGVISDEILNNSNEILVNQASYILDHHDFTPHFSYNDIISIKFAQIDEIAYNFWNDYENQTSFSKNPLFPLSENLATNIDGGLGCWYGCNAVYINLTLKNYKGKEVVIPIISNNGLTIIPQE